MIIIKFGGSVITNKSEECKFKPAITKKLLNELRKYFDENPGDPLDSNSTLKNKKGNKKTDDNIDYDLLLVHGAGSFGHILAKKYQLSEGYKEKEQLIGLTKVHHDVRDLNLKFMNELLAYGFPGISLPPMVILRNRAKMIAYIDSELFNKVLQMHCIPVTFGDVVPDDTYGFSICSGDTIIQKLAEMFSPSKVIFLTDVDGLFTANPAIEPNAKIIKNLTPKSLSSAYTSDNINPDVTGGIFLKSMIALELAKNGIETQIINGNVPERLGAALRGQQVVGTIAK